MDQVKSDAEGRCRYIANVRKGVRIQSVNERYSMMSTVGSQLRPFN